MVLMLGAGFSKWSCELPLASQLFDFQIYVYNKEEESRLRRVAKLYEAWIDGRTEWDVEEFIREYQSVGDKFCLVNWYVTRRLTEQFVVLGGRRHTWYINSYHARDHSGVQSVKLLLERIMNRATLGIVTTNYDMIVEYALTSKGFHYGIPGEQIGHSPYPYPTPVFASGTIPLLKLHGSLSWVGDAKLPDMRGGLTGRCRIIPPIKEKRPPAFLKQQWGSAARLLKHCDALIVFGYSFNEHDYAIRELFRKETGGNAKIAIVDVVDTAEHLQGVFGKRNFKFFNVLEDSVEDDLCAWI